MRVITAPEKYVPDGTPTLFMAGGIKDCPDWQQEFIKAFEGTDITLFNPRRADFDMSNTKVAHEQIAWEYTMLHQAEYISFWFPAETLCPITLYELGFWNRDGKHLFIGMNRYYKKRQDVEIQTFLERGVVPYFYSLDDLTAEIKRFLAL